MKNKFRVILAVATLICVIVVVIISGKGKEYTEYYNYTDQVEVDENLYVEESLVSDEVKIITDELKKQNITGFITKFELNQLEEGYCPTEVIEGGYSYWYEVAAPDAYYYCVVDKDGDVIIVE